MAWLRLNNADVGMLCLLLLALTAAAYLVSVPGKSRGTGWLTGTAVALALHLVARLGVALALSSLDLALVGRALPALLSLDTLFLALSAVSALGFAYAFLGRPFPTEERWIVGAASVATAGLVGLLGATIATAAVSPRMVAVSAFAVTVLAYTGAAVVLARKAVAEECAAASNRPVVTALLRPTTRRANAFRSFAWLMPLGAFVGVAAYGARFSGGSEALVWVSLLGFLLGLIALYVSFAPEPTTLQAKVVAFVLGAALTALAGAVALGNRPDDLARSAGVVAPEQEAVRVVPAAGGGYLTEAAEASLGDPGVPVATPTFWGGARVGLGFDFPFGGRTWRAVDVFPSGYVRFGDGAAGPARTPVIAPLYAPPSPEMWDIERVYVRREADRVAITWLAVTSPEAGENATFQLVLEAGGAVTLRYGDAGFVRVLVRGILPQGTGADALRLDAAGPLPLRVPPAGVVQTVAAATDAHVSQRLLPWVGLVGGVTAAVLIGLPFLLRLSVTRPLARLLDGVRRVEDGDLSVEVPVHGPDEIGRLTGHFNQMTGSLRDAQDALRAYASTLEDRVASRTSELAERNGELSAEKAALAQAIEDLRAAQNRLVQQEKLASLGRLTSGIAHEIKNPLNFVNNFAGLNAELIGELRAELGADPGAAPAVAQASDLFDDIAANTRKIAEHGGRADAIVRGMMDHARGGSEHRRVVDVNETVADQVNAALKGWSGEASGVEVVRDYDARAGSWEVAPQELGRALLNVLSNALDAVGERARMGAAGDGGGAYRPTVTVRTRRTDGRVRVEVEDNGGGFTAGAEDRLFEPFYTTKPTGAGHVGLGLSLARDAVVGHGGELEVANEEGQGATFTITLLAVQEA